MSKVVVRTGDVTGFFERAKNAARRADKGQAMQGTVTLAFEDAQTMFAVLSDARRKLMILDSAVDRLFIRIDDCHN